MYRSKSIQLTISDVDNRQLYCNVFCTKQDCGVDSGNKTLVWIPYKRAQCLDFGQAWGRQQGIYKD